MTVFIGQRLWYMMFNNLFVRWSYLAIGLLWTVQSIQAQPWMDALQHSEDTEVSLLTCGVSGEVYTLYGHSAIRLRSISREVDVVLNYGIYDFNTPGFILKFVRGKLPYRLGATSMQSFIENYEYEGRSVVENKLILTPEHKKELIAFLANNYLPQNRTYAYDFFYDNCSSRIWDVLVATTSDSIVSEPFGQLTFRDMISQYQKPHPWTDLGIQMIIGSPADKLTTVKDQSFIPFFLQEHIKNASIGNQPISKADQILVEQVYANKAPAIHLPMIVALLLLGIELWLFLRTNAQKPALWANVISNTYGVFLAIGGLLLLFMWVGTDHQACHRNYNLLWINPLWLLTQFINKWRKQAVYCIIIGTAFLSLFGPLSILPQDMPWIFVPLILTSMLKALRGFIACRR